MSAPPERDELAGLTWQCVSVLADSSATPADLDVDEWLPATAPGTVADALRQERGLAAAMACDVDAFDWWYRSELPPTDEPADLVFDGLATVAEVWVDGDLVLRTENMFRSHRVAIEPAAQPRPLWIRFLSMSALLAVRRRPGPRWRSGLVATQNLRWYRTTLLGRMPSFAGDAPAVGPWRAVRLVRRRPTVLGCRVELVGDRADLVIEVSGPIDTARVEFAGRAVDVVVEANESGTRLVGRVDVSGLDRWWPHTHGLPALHDLTVSCDSQPGQTVRVGLRTITADRRDGAFALSVNGAPVFARGACWVPLDPISLRNAPDQLRAALDQVLAAGLNLVRVTGTMVYEDDAFYRMCDELGILVWQDFMLATLDPPEDATFNAEIAAEARELARRLGGHACVAVVSGGSESEQQPAMLGLPAEERTLPAIEKLIPSIFGELLPDVPYVTSSPSGGVLPFSVNSGVAHYFGVGGYLRPLADVRTAGVRFAAECLAFATPPERATVDQVFGSSRVAGHDPRWKRAVPRDRGTSWDFEDVRDHYVRELFGVDPAEVRYSDPDRYLDLGRAAVANAMTEVFTQWRRPGSSCAGGLVLTMRDLVPGAGWGLIDSTGVPKAPWHALRRVLAPVALAASDDGLDGVNLLIWNDAASRISAELEISLSNGVTQVATAARSIEIDARGSLTVSVEDVVGRFVDVNHAYRFGPPNVDTVHAQLVGPAGVIAEVTHATTRAMPPPAELSARLLADEGGWSIELSSDRPVRWVAFDVAGWQPDDSWFHLAPGRRRSVRLTPLAPTDRPPRGTVRSLNSPEVHLATEAVNGE